MKIELNGYEVKSLSPCCEEMWQHWGIVFILEPMQHEEVICQTSGNQRIYDIQYCPFCGAKVEILGREL